MHPCLTPLPIGKHSISLYCVVTVASYLEYRLYTSGQSSAEACPFLSEQHIAFHNSHKGLRQSIKCTLT